MNFFQPSAPSLDEPLEILEACHGRIEAQLETLFKLEKHIRTTGADTAAKEAAQRLLNYFDVAGVHHHEDEEQDLFPILRRIAHQDAPLQRLIDQLLIEHQHLACLWAEQRPQLLAVLSGNPEALLPQTIAPLSEAYRAHIAQENTLLLPAARRYLNAADQQTLIISMTARRKRPRP